MNPYNHIVDARQALEEVIRKRAGLVQTVHSYGSSLDRDKIFSDLVYGSWDDAVKAFAEAYYSPQHGMMEAAVLALIRSGVSRKDIKLENGHFIVAFPNMGYVLSKNDEWKGYKARTGYSGRLYGYGPVIAMQPASFAEFVRLFDESIALMKDLMRDIERGIRERRIERERYLMVMRIEAQTERALKGQLALAPDADDSGIPNQPFSGPGWIALT